MIGKRLLLSLLAFACLLWSAPKPMEALDHYNVILIHGAAPSGKGFADLCRGPSVADAWTTLERHLRKPDSTEWQVGNAAGMLGAYNQRGSDKLTSWLDSAVFEDYVYRGGVPFVEDSLSSPYIYIQRSFVNPAGSPAYNAREVGDRTWKGGDGCSSRRALLEEAQEVRAGGQDSLQRKRTDSFAGYRTIPSRNIIIAHSMGGVSSREYVQGGSLYKEDVDKVITLDSPHEGTGAPRRKLKC